MREILFRAKTEPCSKDAISGKIELAPKWVYGYIDLGYMQGEEGAIISSEKARHAYRCQYNTIGQYTSLKDRNGQRIFEGDIVVSANPRRLSNKPFEVKMKPIAGGFGYWKLDNPELVEVIGNIHDNPELLRPSTPQKV